MPRAKRTSVMEEVTGETRFQISRTATETERPVQKVSWSEWPLANSARTTQPMPISTKATKAHVRKISKAERRSI